MQPQSSNFTIIPPGPAADITGQRFGRLTVLGRVHANRTRTGGIAKPHWLCLCDCGNRSVAIATNLSRGHTQSCGCLSQEQVKTRLVTHGQRRTKLYGVWTAMLARCRNSNSKSYQDYGARGITVCERWLDFANFYADMGDAPAGMSIDRINNNRGYEPSNCRWASRKEQNRNNRRNRYITYDGITQTFADWEDALGFSRGLLHARICDRGWTTERALTEPVHGNGPKNK